MFPLFFAALFLSSMALPRDLIETDWFRTIADWNPVSYMLEAIRSLVITGWDGEALALGFALRGRPGADRAGGRVLGAADEDGAHMSRGGFWSVARAVGLAQHPQLLHEPGDRASRRCCSRCSSSPRSRAGSRAWTQIPGFDYGGGYTTFVYGFVLLQASAFGGIFTGFSIARDFESGFSRRLLLAAAAPRRIVAGYWLAALARAMFTVGVDHGRRADRRAGGERQPGRPRRPLHARPARERGGDAVRHRASRCGCARCRPARPMQMPGVPDPVPRARLGALRPAHRLGPGRGLGQPGHARARVGRGFLGGRPDRRCWPAFAIDAAAGRR